MDITLNLKRRKDSGESSAEEEGRKKHCKKLSPKPSQQRETQSHSQSQTPAQPQPKEKTKNKTKSPAPPQRPAQIIPPPQQKLAETPLSPKLPSLSPISTPTYSPGPIR